MENLKIYNTIKQPPREALRTIKGGRLSGMTDVNPQWRYKSMTELFGVCGVGWKYEVAKLWNEPIEGGQVFAFAEVNVYVKIDDKWSDPIPGVGGSMLVTKEQAGLHASDEGYKMAITDALSVAMKMLGMAGDIYAGLFDGTKYSATQPEARPQPEKKPEVKPQTATPPQASTTQEPMSTIPQRLEIFAVGKKMGYTETLIQAVMVRHFATAISKDLTKKQASEMIQLLESGEGLDDKPE